MLATQIEKLHETPTPRNSKHGCLVSRGSSATGTGDAGTISLLISEAVNINDSAISTDARDGRAGTISLLNKI